MRTKKAPLVVAALMVAVLAAARAALRADEEHVWLLGRLFDSACAFRVRFGIPCPNCGMTRSFILAVHGQLGEALRLNPAGPLLVLGMFAAAAMLAFAAIRSRETDVRRWLIPATLAYAGVYVAVLIGHWLAVIL